MKYVIINESNKQKIMNAFKQAQGRATARTIERFSDLTDICKQVDNRLNCISKAAKNGTTVLYNFAQHFPLAYKYVPDSTHFELLFDKGAWRIDLDSIERKMCPRTSRDAMYWLMLSDSAKSAILKLYE